MPSNPSVPREVAEAKGKGSATLVILGVALVIIGVLAMLVMSALESSASSRSRSASATTTAQVVTAASQLAVTYNICSDARDLAVTEEKPVAVIHLRENCWSGRVSGFPDATIGRRDDRDIEFLLEDGSRKLYHGPETIQTTNAFAWARVRGTGDLTLWIPGFASRLPSGEAEAVPTDGVVKYVKRGNLMEPGKLTIEPPRGGERTYVVGVFAFVYRPGHYRTYLDGVRVGDYVHLKLARDDRGFGMFVERIDVMVNPESEKELSADGSNANDESRTPQPDNGLTPSLVEGTVRDRSGDSIRLRPHDQADDVEVTNASSVPVNYRGNRYRLDNLEVGDEIRLFYFPSTETIAEPGRITRPIKIEVLKSSSH